MGILSKKEILEFNDLKQEKLSVPEWGGDVFIRIMTGIERDKFEEWAASSGKSLQGIRARIASMCLVDETGKNLFDEGDIEALGKKSAAALERVVAAAQKLNAVSEEDVKELAKN